MLNQQTVQSYFDEFTKNLEAIEIIPKYLDICPIDLQSFLDKEEDRFIISITVNLEKLQQHLEKNKEENSFLHKIRECLPPFTALYPQGLNFLSNDKELTISFVFKERNIEHFAEKQD